VGPLSLVAVVCRPTFLETSVSKLPSLFFQTSSSPLKKVTQLRRETGGNPFSGQQPLPPSLAFFLSFSSFVVAISSKEYPFRPGHPAVSLSRRPLCRIPLLLLPSQSHVPPKPVFFPVHVSPVRIPSTHGCLGLLRTSTVPLRLATFPDTGTIFPPSPPSPPLSAPGSPPPFPQLLIGLQPPITPGKTIQARGSPVCYSHLLLFPPLFGLSI